MTESLVTQSERAELYRGLAAWVAPSVPAIRDRLKVLGREDLLEDNLGALFVGIIAGMEEQLIRAGRADEARSRGFLAAWDRFNGTTGAERRFPDVDLEINTYNPAPSSLEAAVPLIKSALDYLLAGMRANQEAVLNNRPDLEVLDGNGKVVSRTRKRGAS